MRQIMIRGFESLDNYGTGMMGLVTIDRLHRLLPGNNRFLVDLHPDADPAEVEAELGGPREGLELVPLRRLERQESGLRRRLGKLPIVGRARGIDLVIVLGGDTLADVYTRRSWRYMVAMRGWALDTPVVLLGHTIGPFNLPRSRIAARHLLPALHIYPRDRWTTAYLAEEFGLDRRVVQATDLAYGDLPLQHRADIEREVLDANGLERDRYATHIVSGLQSKGKFYTSDTDLYLRRHAELATAILDRPDMAGNRLLLLAHTHGKAYGDEGSFIRDVATRIPQRLRGRIVTVTDRILQTRARFLLGNGLYTITGRMHPAVSTFQMGKPAITLGYSKKYEGVIGTMLGRHDLILDANHAELWEQGSIIGQVLAKIDYVTAERARLLPEIRAAIARQKSTLDEVFREVAAFIHPEGARQAQH